MIVGKRKVEIDEFSKFENDKNKDLVIEFKFFNNSLDLESSDLEKII